MSLGSLGMAQAYASSAEAKIVAIEGQPRSEEGFLVRGRLTRGGRRVTCRAEIRAVLHGVRLACRVLRGRASAPHEEAGGEREEDEAHDEVGA
eukprot:671178-Pleurochrysis_carterae.AAC.1